MVKRALIVSFRSFLCLFSYYWRLGNNINSVTWPCLSRILCSIMHIAWTLQPWRSLSKCRSVSVVSEMPGGLRHSLKNSWTVVLREGLNPILFLPFKGRYHLSDFYRYLHYRHRFLGILHLFFWTWELFL